MTRIESTMSLFLFPFRIAWLHSLSSHASHCPSPLPIAWFHPLSSHPSHRPPLLSYRLVQLSLTSFSLSPSPSLYPCSTLSPYILLIVPIPFLIAWLYSLSHPSHCPPPLSYRVASPTLLPSFSLSLPPLTSKLK